VSWQTVEYPTHHSSEWQGPYVDPVRGKIYAIRHIAYGGNYTLFEVDLATLTVSSYDLGVPVESTDGHYSPSMCGLTSDRNRLICCRARWSGLRCLQIDLTTKTASWLGEIAPAGDTSLNYPRWFRVRPDKWLMMARTGDGRNWSMFEFRGEPEQILDPALWSKRAVLPNNSGDGSPDTCDEGSINYMYQSGLTQDVYDPEKIWLVYYMRCPLSPYRNTFGLIYYDILRDRFYGWKEDILDETLVYRTYSPELRVDVTPPAGVTVALIGTSTVLRVKTTTYDYVLTGYGVKDPTGAVAAGGLVKADLATKTSTTFSTPTMATDLDSPTVSPLLPTADGKAIVAQGWITALLATYDPATDSLTELIPDFRTDVFVHPKLWVFGEKSLIPATHITSTKKHALLWSGWATDMKMLTKCIATGGVGSLAVDADFWPTVPSSLVINIYKLPDLTLELTETIANPARPFSKTYSVTAGSKRVQCKAIP